jgi:predicted GNAT family N-acyltransferase
VISAYDVSASHVSIDGTETGYGFGVSTDQLVCELRLLAQAIEEKRVLVDRVVSVQVARSDDWAKSRVVLFMTEKLAVW